MKLKYLMFETAIGQGMFQHIPVLFFEPITHIGMYHTIKETRVREWTSQYHLRLVSAGFVNIFPIRGKIECTGKSESLETAGLPCVPLPTDGDTILCYNVLTGVQP